MNRRTLLAPLAGLAALLALPAGLAAQSAPAITQLFLASGARADGSTCNTVPYLVGFTVANVPDGESTPLQFSGSYDDGAGHSGPLELANAQYNGAGTVSGYQDFAPSGLSGSFTLGFSASYFDGESADLLASASFPASFETCSCEAPLVLGPPMGVSATGTGPANAGPAVCAGDAMAQFWQFPDECHAPLAGAPNMTISYVNADGVPETFSPVAVAPTIGYTSGGEVIFTMPYDVTANPTLTFTALDDDGNPLASAQWTYPAIGLGPGCGAQLAVCVPDGTMMFEDNWPSDGDLDFNDQVVSYNYQYLIQEAGFVVSQLQATFNVLSVGAQYHNGLYMHLVGVPSTLDASIELTRSDGVVTHPAPVAGEDEMVIPIVEDTRSLFPGAGAGFINTDAALPAVQGLAISASIVFHDNPDFSLTYFVIDAEPVDLFLARTGDYGHQIHLPVYAGTQLADTSLYQSGQDNSYFDGQGTPGIYYVNRSGLPFALDVPDLSPWAQEQDDISNLYGEISTFAATGAPANWYTQPDTSTSGDAYLGGAGGTRPPTPLSVLPPLQGVRGACAPAGFGGGATARADHR